MEYNVIYRNGKPERFFIKLDHMHEYPFLQPYFILTSIDKPRFGDILEMECLFSASVWQGRQRHGYGYSCSHDVYATLINAINKLHKGKLTEDALKEINSINPDNSTLKLSAETLAELSILNGEALSEKFRKKAHA